MSSFKNNKAFVKSDIASLKTSSSKFLSDSKRLIKETKKELEDLKATINELPSDVIDSNIIKNIDNFEFVSEGEISEVESQMNKALNRVETVVYPADAAAALGIKGVKESLDNISSSAKGMKDMLNIVSVNSDPKAFIKKVDKVLKEMDRTAKGLKELEKLIKGLDEVANKFSKDPVNLATGNLIYDKVDISTSSLKPIIFKRFYNSLDDFKGSLGANWIHNFEYKMEFRDNEIVVTFDDGHIETFIREYAKTYLSNKKTRLVKEEIIKVYANNRVLSFNEDGQIIEIEEDKKVLKLEYEEDRLIAIRHLKECLVFSYNDNHQIDCITNEMGYQVYYEYDNDDNLIKCNDINNKLYQYKYDEEHGMLEAINPKGVKVLVNEFDDEQRTIKQYFPDGATMSYYYDDENKLIEMYERNSQIVKYYHNEKLQNNKVEFDDGSEEYTYNEFYQRINYRDKKHKSYQNKYDINGNLVTMVDPLKNRKMMNYDKRSNLLGITLENNAKYKFSYDDNDNMTKMINALEDEVNIEYNDKNLPIKVSNFDGSIKLYDYDDSGNLIKQVDELENVTEFEYNEFNQLVKMIKPDLNTIEYQYNNTNKVIKVINEAKQTREFTYNIIDDPIEIKDFDDKVTKIEYNVLNKISAIVEPSGAKTVIEYDKMWNVSKVIFANEASQEYHYNILNQLESFTNELDGKIYYKYDSNGNIVEISDDKKSKVTKTYDALNRELEIFENNKLVTSYEYDSVGNVIKAVDGANNYQRFEYDLNNNLMGSIDQEGHKTSYTYTSLNEIETITNPYGGQIRYEYYAGGLLKKVIDADNNYEFYEYDVLQNVKKIDYNNKSALEVEYDVLGNIIKETNDFGLSKHYKYDVSNNVIEIKDESDNVTLYEYDINNNLIRVVDCLNGVMEYDYDIMNNLRTVSQINESNSQRLYEYQRNALGQITKTINSDNSIEEQEFDEYGTLLKKVNRDGSYKTYQYDSLKLLKLIETSDGESIKYEYDALKQVRNVRDKLGLTSFEYDKRGNVTQVKDVNGKVVKYKYGALNEIVKHIYPDSSEVNYQFDSAMKLTKLESEEHTINYQYQDGLVALKQVGDLTSKYEYDNLNRLTRLRHQNKNEILEDYQYQYDSKSNIIGLNKQRVKAQQDSGQFSYEYDKLDRLTKVKQNNEMVHAYEYDSFGNRLKMSSKNKDILYKYNDYSQLVSEIDNEVVKEYSYYPSGNLKSIRQNNQVINEYQYNIDNRLVKARSNKGEVKFQYDSFNKLVSKESNDNHYEYVVDHLKEYDDIILATSNKQAKHYLYDGFGLATQDSKVAMLDHLGSAINLYDAINNEVQPRVFDEFGNSSNINDGDIGYTGYLFDEVSQLNYAQARFYDSQNARFNGLDNIVNFDEKKIGFNRYTYVLNNPNRYIDKDGNVPLAAIGAGIGAIAGGISGGYKAYKKGGNWKDIAAGAAKSGIKGAIYGAVAGATFGVASGALAGASGGAIAGVKAIAGTPILNGVISSGATATYRMINGKKVLSEDLFKSYSVGFVGGNIASAIGKLLPHASTTGKTLEQIRRNKFLTNSLRNFIAGLPSAIGSSLTGVAIDNATSEKSVSELLSDFSISTLVSLLLSRAGIFYSMNDVSSGTYDFSSDLMQQIVDGNETKK